MFEIPWFKVDDKFHSHPKVMELDLSAVGLWTLAGTWCADYLTDGFIRKGQVRRLGGTDDEISQLVEAGLWEAAEGGWKFRDWHNYQPSKESVEQERKAKEVSGRLAAHKRWHEGKNVVSPECEFCGPNADEKGASSRPFSEPYGYTYRSPHRSPHGSTNADSMRIDAPVPEPVINPPSPDIANTHETKSEEEEGTFDEWWKHYPKKVDKGDARKAFDKALQKTTAQQLIDGAKGYANFCENTNREKRFIKGPARWLNVEGWSNTDELATPAAKKPSGWDLPPEAYMHPEEVEDERRRKAQTQRDR